VAERLRLNSILALDFDREAELDASLDEPGYLRGRLGARHLAVPFNLVEGLAPRPLLEQIANVGDQIRIDIESRLCVSGSSAYLGDLHVIADIDFAEYATVDPPRIAARLMALAKREGAPHLIEVKIDGHPLRHPWADCPDHATRLLTQNLAAPPANKAMFDFIDGSTFLGVTPITNLVLPILADRPHDGAAAGSYPFQEVILMHVDSEVPRLAERGVLAAYANFLRGELEKKRISDGDGG
jgi:hypothetical protein